MSEQVVVVGVDGSPASYTALRWALGYVGRSGGRLRAVRCFRPVTVPAWETAVTGEPVPPVAEQRLRAERELDQVVAAALVRTGDGAAVRRRVVRGPAGRGLVAEARGAALLVVGSHGHRRLAQLAHRSVSAYCIRHASCPVVVIPPEIGLRGDIPDGSAWTRPATLGPHEGRRATRMSTSASRPVWVTGAALLRARRHSVPGEIPAETSHADTLRAVPDAAGPAQPGMIGHIPAQPTRPDRMGFLDLPAVLVRSVTGVADMSAVLLALPGRLVGLVSDAEQTLAAARMTVARIQALLDRVDGITGTADEAIHAAHRTTTAAAAVVEQAAALTASAAPLLASYAEPLRRLEPAARRLAGTTVPDEVEALVRLLDRLPDLAEAMDHDVLPLLGRLGQLSPDIDELLDGVGQLNHLIHRLPKLWRRHHHGAADDLHAVPR